MEKKNYANFKMIRLRLLQIHQYNIHNVWRKPWQLQWFYESWYNNDMQVIWELYCGHRMKEVRVPSLYVNTRKSFDSIIAVSDTGRWNYSRTTCSVKWPKKVGTGINAMYLYYNQILEWCNTDSMINYFWLHS